jgi:hypothetical protein
VASMSPSENPPLALSGTQHDFFASYGLAYITYRRTIQYYRIKLQH